MSSDGVESHQMLVVNQHQDPNGNLVVQAPAQHYYDGMQYNQSQQAYVNPVPSMNQMPPNTCDGGDMSGNMQYAANQAQYMYQSNPQITQQSANAVQYQQPPTVQQPQQPQQLSFGGKYIPKPWHTDDPDMKAVRENMCGIIVQLLQQRRPDASADWREKLPQMSKRLEDALYHAANSMEEYNDEKTLKTRLQQLALQMGTSKSSRPNSSIPPKGQSGQQLPQNIANVPVQKSGSSNGSSSGNGNVQWSASQNSHQEEHRRQILKQQQQRLLLLRHASKCQYENGTCVVSSYCGSMKTLWKHIVSCKDQECKTKHCVSSRYVLSHY
jgi:E1A/CREB-binding protein